MFCFLLRDWHGAHHLYLYCTYTANASRCVHVCDCYTKIKMHNNRLHDVRTPCICTLKKCSCSCEWLYTTYFFNFIFSLFLLLRSSALCRAVGKFSSCVFIHGIFFASLLACWMFHLHFCCHFTLPSNAMRALCVYTVHTTYIHTRQKCCDSACFVLSSGFAWWLVV